VKILTVLGTRPEIIRLSLIISKLDQLVEHRLVHTGQNYDPKLSENFFAELGVRDPDHYLGVTGPSLGRQLGQLFEKIEEVLAAERPDRLLVLGDTNSALSAVIAKRMGIPVYHMEAGNRCHDDRVPEEVNRRIIDHSSDVLMPYTESSRANLVAEGIPRQRIYVTGNPILEVIEHHDAKISASKAHASLGVEPDRFFLVTLHRAENVDLPERLQAFVAAFSALAETYNVPVIVSTHPRTRARIDQSPDLKPGAGVRFVEPMGFFDFVSLERSALCVLSDSGTVQEECAIFGRPNVTLRDVTERPETIDCGSNYLSGANLESILRGVALTTSQEQLWQPPQEYLARSVSDTVLRIVTGYRHELDA
jgi:UDP-N-acetylglucosamine 2-epimerase (non-hydrolysing)